MGVPEGTVAEPKQRHCKGSWSKVLESLRTNRSQKMLE